jgi:hypothetical protein
MFEAVQVAEQLAEEAAVDFVAKRSGLNAGEGLRVQRAGKD